VPAAALVDLFGNVAGDAVSQTLLWPAADGVVEDDTPPSLQRVCVSSAGVLELEFSEPLDVTSAASEIQVDAAAIAWTASADGYTLRSQSALTAGAHQLAISTSVVDLVGLELVEGFSSSFTVEAGNSLSVFEAPAPGVGTASTIGNSFGWKGLPQDQETGLYYVRHRYYDPDLGRFLTTDPYGYADGPNPYQFALNDPINLSDPTGEIVETAWDAASFTVGVFSLANNLLEGNYEMAALDALGVVLDGLATLAPFVPGGAGMAIRASRAAGWLGRAQHLDQALNVAQGIYQANQEYQNGNYGWSAFYGGMSALGIHQMRASPFEFQLRGMGSNGGNVRIGRKDLARNVPSGTARFIDSGGTILDRASINTTISTQRQGRHVKGAREYRGGSYFSSADDAQRVLDDFHSGAADILGVKGNDIVVRTPNVTGFNHNPRSGFYSQPTNVFFIKGSSSPSVVPYNPTWIP
jgi:RHS repeat-associated protein